MDELIVRTLKITQQNKYDIFSFFIEAKDIIRIADISRIKRDSNDNLVGLQRKEVKKHVKDITDYLDSDNVLFPNSIILAISDEVTFTKARGPKIESDLYSTVAH